MNLNIKYFGMLTEITQRNEEIIAFEKQTIGDLLQILFKKYPLLEGKNFQIAANQKIVTKSSIITETEIALLPPFAGG